MKKLLITEKPSVAMEFAKVLKLGNNRKNGYIENEEWVITWCVGHLVTMSYPEKYDEKLKFWRLDTLPFIPEEFKYEVIPQVEKQFEIIKTLFQRDDIDTIYVSTDSGREGEYISVLEKCCNIESPTENKEAVDRVGKYFIDKALKRGWQVEINKQSVSGDAICITLNAEVNAPSVCFSAHLDTVQPIGIFGYPPTKIEGDKIIGPGVSDCKGGAVSAFMAMHALEDIGFKARPVKLILQSDEEVHSSLSNHKTLEFMVEEAMGSAAFLNAENIEPDRTLTIGRKGITSHKIIIKGKKS